MKRAGNIPENAPAQFLDNLEVERERGITVKAQTASMLVKNKRDGENYLLNLIDTPGHVDFSYEVEKSLAACQGVLMLVDSTQGVQAQTLSTFHSAQKHELDIIPIITKIDLPHSDILRCKQQIVEIMKTKDSDILCCSAKQGIGIDAIFNRIMDQIIWPQGNRKAPLRARVCDSWYDTYKGIVCTIQIEDGEINQGDEVILHHSNSKFEVQELGLLLPFSVPVHTLRAGHIGYVILGCRDNKQILLGDTILLSNMEPKPAPLPHFSIPKSMVFASVFPVDQSSFEEMRIAIERLLLNDNSVTVTQETSEALGMGFRCGYLGVLHMNIFQERLFKEFGMPVLVTAPFVPHYAILKQNHRKILIKKPSEMPVPSDLECVLQPMTRVTILTPKETVGTLMSLCRDRRGEELSIQYLDNSLVLMEYCLPWSEVVVDFYDMVKNLSSGYASLEYEEDEWQEDDIVKVDILINSKPVDALAFVCNRKQVESRGRQILLRLKEEISRQQFEVILQAAVGSKIFARERIPPYRKDVLVKGGKLVGGGDSTRKKKLLEAQKRGKKRLRTISNVEIPQEAFLAVLNRKSGQ
ncbi:hypothetical protein WA171_003669 [Blastocystis sp. BT1]